MGQHVFTGQNTQHTVHPECDSLTVRALACHAADPGSNPAGGFEATKVKDTSWISG